MSKEASAGIKGSVNLAGQWFEGIGKIVYNTAPSVAKQMLGRCAATWCGWIGPPTRSR